MLPIRLGLLALLSLGCASSPLPTSPLTDPSTRFECVVLGIAQDGGLPHLGCQKECCVSARASGRTLSPASLAILDHETGKTLLIEASPAIESQLARLRRVTATEERPRHPVDAVLITHAHIGHYAGLVHFGREVASTRAIPLHVSPRMAEYLANNGPWSQLVALEQVDLTPFTAGQPFSPIEGITVTAISVPHRDEFSDTVAFRVEGPTRTILFCPDIDRYEGNQLETLIDGVDVAYLDATFYDGRELPGRDLAEIPHPPMVVTMERLASAARKSPGRFRFIHLNHTNPALHDEQIRAEIKERGFHVAHEGERLGL